MQRTGAEHTASARLSVCVCVCVCVFVCDSSFIPVLPSCTADSDSAAQHWRTGSELARLPPDISHPYVSARPIVKTRGSVVNQRLKGTTCRTLFYKRTLYNIMLWPATNDYFHYRLIWKMLENSTNIFHHNSQGLKGAVCNNSHALSAF